MLVQKPTYSSLNENFHQLKGNLHR